MIKNKTNFLKAIVLIAISIMALTSLFLLAVNIPAVYAMELEDGNEYDEVFLENMEVLAKDNYGTDYNLVAQKELLYDIELNRFGYIYDFSVNDEKGYAIVVNTTGAFEIPEIFFDAKNPFEVTEDSKRIYVGDMTYLYFDNDNYYFVQNNAIVTLEMLTEIKKVALYSGYSDFTYDYETINYVSKSENSHKLATRHPNITDSAKFTNECSAIAGANIIQYWDRYCTELIPNYVPGGSVGSSYLYYGESINTTNVISELYYDMGTNTDGAGTTVSQFKNGLAKYIKRNGNYSITFAICNSGGKFSYDSAKQFLDDAQPIALFLTAFNITTLNESADNTSLAITLSSYNHAMVAFGYRDITYNLTNGGLRNDKYFAVATGISEEPRGYFNINYKTNIDEAWAINIY